ncbi:MFS transporter [Sporichthya polymorpha]|uniref:MFS transporter n=1 Tax=Sporichthya polymorpha TaxID=35751 RepID=UPI0012EB1A83|nr:MFS transporter [Sporichthya polymorpha]
MSPGDPPPPYGAPPPPYGSEAGPGPTPSNTGPNGGPPPPTDEMGLFAAWRLAARSTARASAKTAGATRRTVRRATNAQGAGESGMAKLTELSGLNAAGDILVTIALAGTLFFNPSDADQARGRVALFLLITMVPFALLAPLIGPLLDKFRSGRRWALATTFLTRAVLAWTIAGGVQDADLFIYAGAFGCLMASKAYVLIKAAGVPRLLPPGIPLVRANSWTNMAGLAAATVATAAVAPIQSVAGPEWTLRIATVLFAIGVVLSLRLPARIDSDAADSPASFEARSGLGKGRYVGAAVDTGVRANAAFRGLSGFLTLYLAFLLREHPIGDMNGNVQLGLVIGAAGVGSAAGTAVGSAIKTRGPEIVIVALLVADVAAIFAAAIWYGITIVLAAGFVVGFAQTLGKLSLDSMIQRDVEEAVQSSAFARSETRLQLAWVIGGAIGIALPLRGGLAFAVAGIAIVGLTLEMLRHGKVSRDQVKARKQGPPAPAPPRADANPPTTPPTEPRPRDFPPTRYRGDDSY